LDRESAERALGIIREVIQNTRDDLIARNWCVIWMVLGFVNLVGAAAGTIVEQRQLSVLWFLAPLLAVGLADIAVVLLLVKRDRGVRSIVEWQLWGIWLAYGIVTITAILVLELTQAPARLFGPLFALISGFGFAMMGVVFYGRFLIVAAMMLIVTFATALFPAVQWYVIGIAWWGASFVPGISMHLQHQKRLHHGRDSRIL